MGTLHAQIEKCKQEQQQKGTAGACKPKLQELKHNFEKLSSFKLKSIWAGAGVQGMGYSPRKDLR